MRKKIKYIIPSIITLFILSLIFYRNGLYPFGSYSIIQVDADYQFVPILYRIYDFLHEFKGIIYDDIGFGNNIYISMIIQGSLFSPVNFFLYFCERGNIVNYFNIILMIKLSLISLTTYIYINNTYKINYFYKVICSLIYTFSGFVFLNYFNIMWLDCVILFPIIVMYLDKLLKKDQYVGYVICLSLSLMISYYISYFILLFILFYTFLNITLFECKRKKQIIFRLGFSTFISFLISSFSFLPCLYQTLISSRFSYSSNFILFSDTMAKSLYIFFSPLFVIFFLKLIGKFKIDKKQIYFYIVLLLLFTIGILIEPINLLMHGGSYWDFPFRYGFVSNFILMMACLYYVENFKVLGNSKSDIVKVIFIFSFTIALIYFNQLFADEIQNERIFLNFENLEIYLKIIIIFILLLIINELILGLKNDNLRYVFLSFITVLGIFIFSYFTMFYNDGYFLTSNMNYINNNMNIHRDGRYKIDYTTYTPDYGFILSVSTLDNWLHLIPESQIDTYDKLGYDVDGTCIRSLGGTIFSDWLFNVKYIISNDQKNNDFYEIIDNYEEYYLYKYNLNESYGIIYDDIIDDYNFNGSFDFQNIIYRNLNSVDEDIIDITNYHYSGNEIYLNYQVKENGFLYLDTDENELIDYIEVNGKYITEINNYIEELGFYDSDVLIHIKLFDDYDINFDLGFIESNKINKFDSDVEFINGKYYAKTFEEGKNLFLPINDIDGLKVYVNGRKIDYDIYFNNFVSVKLDLGDNEIEVKYEMPLFKLGIVFSILGIILLIFVKFIPFDVKLSSLIYYFFYGFVILLFLYYYFYSMIKYLINLSNSV